MSSVLKGRSQIIEQENTVACESVEGPYGGINIPVQVQQNGQAAKQKGLESGAHQDEEAGLQTLPPSSFRNDRYARNL